MINDARLLKLTQKLISFNSENPPGNEGPIAQFIAADMRSLGLEVRLYEYAKGRPNVIATLRGSSPRKEAARQAVLLTPHIDTVPIGGGWKQDPLGGKIKAGKLYGRGTSDDKGNAAAAIEVMRSLVEDGFRPRKDIIMAATVDEECGSKLGILPLLEKKVLTPGFAIVLDSSEFDAIIAQKGLLHVRIQIYGKKAHGAYNWRGINAIEQMAEVIARIKKYRFTYKRHPLLHAPTVNIGVIKGGDKVNIVADFCEASVDIRFMPGMDGRVLIAEVKRIVSAVTKKYKIIVDDLQLPYEIAPGHPGVTAYLNAAKALRAPAHCKGSEGATVISFFKRVGIPAFATGFGAHETAHITDEYIKTATLCKGARVLEKFVKEYDAQ